MTNMENIVRPFQAPSISPASIRLERPEALGVTRVSLGGSGGTSVTFTLTGDRAIVLPNKEKYREIDRKSTLVRVENEDDPEQFVELCRTDSINFKEDKAENKDERNYRESGYTTRTTGNVTTIFGYEDREKLREYDLQHPRDKTCVPPNPERGGTC